jgi:hypothetical protein
MFLLGLEGGVSRESISDCNTSYYFSKTKSETATSIDGSEWNSRIWYINFSQFNNPKMS